VDALLLRAEHDEVPRHPAHFEQDVSLPEKAGATSETVPEDEARCLVLALVAAVKDCMTDQDTLRRIHARLVELAPVGRALPADSGESQIEVDGDIGSDREDRSSEMREAQEGSQVWHDRGRYPFLARPGSGSNGEIDWGEGDR
jgi:hypothetical protein